MHRHLLQFNGRVIEARVSEFSDRVLVTLAASHKVTTTADEYDVLFNWIRPLLQVPAGRHVHVLDPQHVLTT